MKEKRRKSRESFEGERKDCKDQADLLSDLSPNLSLINCMVHSNLCVSGQTERQ